MTTDHIDRIYHMLEAQNKIMAEHGEGLARIEQKQDSMNDILNGVNSQPGLIHVVARHSKQLNIWRGAVTVLTFLWTGMAAWAGVALKRH
jgi:predicted DNA-binding ArsR family transcriptional regulator